jgi:hypothetical protein
VDLVFVLLVAMFDALKNRSILENFKGNFVLDYVNWLKSLLLEIKVDTGLSILFNEIGFVPGVEVGDVGIKVLQIDLRQEGEEVPANVDKDVVILDFGRSELVLNFLSVLADHVVGGVQFVLLVEFFLEILQSSQTEVPIGSRRSRRVKVHVENSAVETEGSLGVLSITLTMLRNILELVGEDINSKVGLPGITDEGLLDFVRRLAGDVLHVGRHRLESSVKSLHDDVEVAVGCFALEKIVLVIVAEITERVSFADAIDRFSRIEGYNE